MAEDELQPIRFVHDPVDRGVDPVLEVSGVDLLKGSYITNIKYELGEDLVPTFTITLAMHRVEIEGTAKIELEAENHALLLKLGWRPPESAPEQAL